MYANIIVSMRDGTYHTVYEVSPGSPGTLRLFFDDDDDTSGHACPTGKVAEVPTLDIATIQANF